MLLIRIGKSISAIRDNGWRQGLALIFGGLKRFFLPVKAGDVLIVAAGAGDSTRYRAHHYAEELNLNGIKTSIVMQDRPFLLPLVKRFKVFIFQRTLVTAKIKQLVKEIKKQNKEIIFETDDLVYDPKFIQHMDYYQKMNSLEKKLYQNGVGGEILRDNYVKVCTTSTNFLKRKLEEEGKKVFLVKNKLSKEDVKWGKEILNNKFQISNSYDDKVRLGYFSGTFSHNKDFDTIRRPLMRILENNSNVRLCLAGPLDINDELSQKFGQQIERIPFVERKKHFEHIARVDINLVPLEIDNPFCQAKSELKFFSAGLVKVPTVASATDTFIEAIEDGVDGFVAKNETEWETKLQQLIDSPELRQRLGEKAYETTIKKYTTENANNEEYYEYLRKKISNLEF